jgi:hypothetical protein
LLCSRICQPGLRAAQTPHSPALGSCAGVSNMRSATAGPEEAAC